MEKKINRIFNKIKNIILVIINYFYEGIFWYVDYWEINKKKIKECKKWLNKHFCDICNKENITVKYTKKINNNEIVLGTYQKYYKKIILLSSYMYFQKELTFLHELGHHFLWRIGNHSESDVDKFCINIIKTFPKWIIKIMQIDITVWLNISDEEFYNKFDLSIYNILKSWRL